MKHIGCNLGEVVGRHKPKFVSFPPWKVRCLPVPDALFIIGGVCGSRGYIRWFSIYPDSGLNHKAY